MLAGLIGGVAVSRNAEAMTAPVAAAVVLAALAGCGFCWFAAYRGKSVAVATAVSSAVASARAEAAAEAEALSAALAASEARAAALASVTVNVGDGGERPQDSPAITTSTDRALLSPPLDFPRPAEPVVVVQESPRVEF
jgi:hypothetical protein